MFVFVPLIFALVSQPRYACPCSCHLVAMFYSALSFSSVMFVLFPLYSLTFHSRRLVAMFPLVHTHARVAIVKVSSPHLGSRPFFVIPSSDHLFHYHQPSLSFVLTFPMTFCYRFFSVDLFSLFFFLGLFYPFSIFFLSKRKFTNEFRSVSIERRIIPFL